MEHISKTLQNSNINKVYNREALSDAIIDLGCIPNDLNTISQQLDELYNDSVRIQHKITLINKELIRIVSRIKEDSNTARYSL
tara:strand:+ start:1407 stop:1655 length:249 start_codon:yes stop_codon:yes gene_type:complete